MHSNQFSSFALLLSSLAGPSQAFWRLSCGTIQTGRIDPIVTPGTIAGHAHKVAGGSNFGLSSDYQSLQQSNCTSCEIGADKSAYWTPNLYYHHQNGSFEEVQNGGMSVYYLGRGDNRTNIQPFPPGFRMVSGVPSARSYDTQKLIPNSHRPQADRVSFACLDVNPSKEQPGMTQTNCKNGLRTQIRFQSCWDGVNLYKDDNSHVEYMSDIDNGNCPSSHPVPLIHLFFEVLYSVNDIKQDGGKFVFSQGDATGYGFHGDFMNGWDPATLKSAIDQGCATSTGGAVGDCAAFKATDNSKSFAQSCPERPAIVDEPVHGMISKLPGCITITSGPGAATKADMTCASEVSSMNGTISTGSNSTVSSAGAALSSVGSVTATSGTASGSKSVPITSAASSLASTHVAASAASSSVSDNNENDSANANSTDDDSADSNNTDKNSN